ncbi:hypothetical protein ACFL3C_01915 [Patescibacteria group bacterium]
MDNRVREALRSGKINLLGRVSDEDQETIDRIGDEIEGVWAGVDAVLKALSEEEEPVGIGEQFREIYESVAKAYVRYRKENPGERLRYGPSRFLEEMMKMGRLFAKHGISVNADVLRNTMTYHGYAYWRDFFESDECKPFKDSPWVIRRTILRHPRDCREFLATAAQNAQATLNKNGNVRPGEAMAAEINRPRIGSDLFLEGVDREVQELSEDPRINPLIRGKKWLLRRAARKNTQDPIGYLIEVWEKFDAIMHNKEFEEFWSSKSNLLKVAADYDDPEEFLRNAKTKMDAILEEEEFSQFFAENLLWIVRKAVLLSPRKARKFLRSLLAEQITILDEVEFEYLQDAPEEVLYAAGLYPKDPRPYLRKMNAEAA